MSARGFAVVASVFVVGAAACVLGSGASGCAALAGVETLTIHDAGVDVPGLLLPDASRHDAPGRDASGLDARDAGTDAPPAGGAVVVASSSIASDWCAVTNAGDVECWGENESGELGNGNLTTTFTPQKVQGLPGPAASVCVGVGSACALTRAGAAYCWGNSDDGELGNGTTNQSETAVAVSGLGSGVTAISCGYGDACAIQGGAVWCWGSSSGGTAGTDGENDAFVPAIVPGLGSDVTALAVGGLVACAVKSGAVFCWGGFDGSGELGNGTTDGSFMPVPVKGLESGVTAVSTGEDFACALNDKGGVLCWGDGQEGQLGNGQSLGSPTPAAVTGLSAGVRALSAGQASVTAIKTDGSVVAWGNASDGELGNGSYEVDSGVGVAGSGISATPVAVKNIGEAAVAVATGAAPCVATSSGAVLCWGVIGDNAPTPVPVQNLRAASSITMGGNLSPGEFTCAISQGSIYCWGGNGSGQLGNDTTMAETSPYGSPTLMEGATVVSAAFGGNFACGVVGGVAYCWGDNTSGQLGNGSTVSSKSPVGVSGLTSHVFSIAAGGSTACAIVAGSSDAGGPDAAGSDGGFVDGGAPSGGVMCWGDNTFGELGNGSTTSSLVPVVVTGLSSGVTGITLGLDFACAALVNGTVDCWGINANGNIGDGTTQNRLSPTKVALLAGTTATSVSAGFGTACAVASGGIQCWGNNNFGQLGNDSTDESSTPVAVAGISSAATQVSCGVDLTCAVVGGGAQCWGSSALGAYLTPYEFAQTPGGVVGLAVGVTGVAASNGSACAAAAGGVECWGLNSAGQLGNGGAVDSFLPVPVVGFP
jgi:alpha-tubulin suppressor-like RCC1 family protein